MARPRTVHVDADCGGGGVALRKCLGCGRPFRSKGFGNRICPDCDRLGDSGREPMRVHMGKPLPPGKEIG